MTLSLADIPVLETERLTLSAPDLREWPGYRALYLSERSQWCGGPLIEPRAWLSLAGHLGHWALRGFGMFAVRTREDGRSVGMVGHFRPEGWPEREIGWLLWDGETGKGYAVEAARAARAHAYDRLGWEGAVSYIAPANTGSIRVAERLGCVADPGHRAITEADDALVFRHPGPESVA